MIFVFFLISSSLFSCLIIDELTNPQNVNADNAETTGYQIGGRRTLVQGGSNTTSKGKDPGFISPYDPKKKLKGQDKEKTKVEKRDLTSYIFNEDMKKIRHAESVILGAEARFGVFSRDPQGRLVPIVQVIEFCGNIFFFPKLAFFQ